METGSSILRHYKQKSANSVGIDITHLTHNKCISKNAILRGSGTNLQDVGVLIPISEEKIEDNKKNIAYIPTHLASQRGIKASQLGVASLINIGGKDYIWTKPANYEDSDASQVAKNLTETKGKYGIVSKRRQIIK